MFKKTNAVYIESMRKLTNVTVTEETVKANIGYYDLTFQPEEIPKVLADFMELYAAVKPTLDKKQAQLEKERAESQEAVDKGGAVVDDKPIDLSEIPF